MDYLERLLAVKDSEYAKFHAKLIPNINASLILGIRVPEARKLARILYKDPEHYEYMGMLPHRFYDENVLHGLLISEEKNLDKCIALLDDFLPYVDNWAVCDIISPKIFKKNKTVLLPHVRSWISSEHSYTCRFGIEMLMTHYLDGDSFKPEYLEWPAKIRSDEYYVNMMITWFFATALAKQWNDVIPYIEKKRLDKWTHNKTIQKARESYRITPEQKEYLKGLKLK